MSVPDRKGFIGSSDIPVIIGVSTFKDALRLYAEKRGELEPDALETKVIRRGKLFEPLIARVYAEDSGADVSAGTSLQMPNAPYFRAQIDAFENAGGDDVIPLEIKSASEFTRGKWGASGTDDAPTQYCAQLHWQLLATGAPYGRIVALLGADDLRVYTIERDKKVGEFLLAQAQEFWARVQTGNPPEIDCQHPTAGDTLAALFRNFNATEILQADDALRSWRDVMVEAGELATRYEATKASARAHLLAAMRNAGVIDFGDGQIFERRIIKRKGYVVEPTEYVDGRVKRAKASETLALPERAEA